jgi:tRNA C32,U32 (ribose-2'-O)-methylase TrmJ
MPFHIILVHPEIPQNTGSIGRLCVSTNSQLHLVHPLGHGHVVAVGSEGSSACRVRNSHSLQ